MANQVLWALDNEIEYKKFERLCIDLLYRNGYKFIIPVGGMHDRGRDAEEFGREGTDDAGKRTFFQFTKQGDWRKKLKSELRKIHREGHQVSKLIFVTTQDVSGRERDQLGDEVKRDYGWDLTILSREWLRLQLEEAHPDLAQKYLGVLLPGSPYIFAGSFKFQRLDEVDLGRAWEAFSVGDFERAVVELRGYVLKNPKTSAAWEVLSWSLYQTFRYDDALAAINKAIDLAPGSMQMQNIRACILTESGIERGDLERIREARQIFSDLLGSNQSGLLHYNYANALGALGDHEQAVIHYRMAVELEPSDAQIWKNLATAYHEVGRHDDEMKCFDIAISLEPDMPQALMSKGVSLMVDLDKPQEGATLMERALEVSRDLGLRWPHAWYWLGEAYLRMGNFEKSLKWIAEGLLHSPGHAGLRQLQARVYSEIWRKDDTRKEESMDYFRNLLAKEPSYFAARAELAKILELSGNLDGAWSLIEQSFEVLELRVGVKLRDIGFELADCCRALKHLPEYVSQRKRYPVSDYRDHHPEFLVNDTFEEYLFVGSAITFGLAKEEISFFAGGDFVEERERVEEICFVLLDRIRRCVLLSVREVMASLREMTDEESRSRVIALLLIFVPGVANEEWIVQLGWLVAIFELPEDVVNSVISRFAESGPMTATVGTILNEIHRLTNLFPEDDTS